MHIDRTDNSQKGEPRIAEKQEAVHLIICHLPTLEVGATRPLLVLMVLTLVRPAVRAAQAASFSSN